MGGYLVTFWLMGGVPPQPGYNGKPCGTRIHSQSDCLILLPKISLLYLSNSFFVWQFNIMTETYRINFGYWWLLKFFPKCPLKSSLFLKIQNNFSINMQIWVIQMSTTKYHICGFYIYIYIYNSFFTFDINLCTVFTLRYQIKNR